MLRRADWTYRAGVALTCTADRLAASLTTELLLLLLRAFAHLQMIDDGTVTAVNLSEAPGDPAGDGDPEGPITLLTRVETMIKLA